MNCNRMPHQGVPEEIERLVKGAPQGTFDSALLAGGWNLLSQDGLATLQLCARCGVAVHVAGVFASGLRVGGGTCSEPSPNLLATFPRLARRRRHLRVQSRAAGGCRSCEAVGRASGGARA
mmetsp:Transcript_17638/g.57890  ORF Transcript_17638/g.57890 Transcript_17638/m.57890 type:complete len:121 (-) Transcript_17638:863-1225(-)